MNAILNRAKAALGVLKIQIDPAVAEALASVAPVGQDVVAELTRVKLLNDEATLRRMLRHWVSEVDEPVLVIDRDFNLVGLGPSATIGEPARIFVRAADFREEAAR